MNILNQPVSYYQTARDASSKVTVNLYHYLTTPDPQADQQLLKVRTAATKEKQKVLKESLPSITPSGTFAHRNNSSLITPTSLIQFDLDYKDNTDCPQWDILPTVLKELPWIAYMGRSASGTGYWGLLHVADPANYSQHMEAFSGLLSQRYGLNVDDCSKVLSQPRFYAYDATAYINTEPTPYSDIVLPKSSTPQPTARSTEAPEKLAHYVREILHSKVDITGDRKQWVRVGLALKSELGEAGEDTFIDICQFSPTFDLDECRKTYRGLKPTSLSIGTFIHLCHEHGVRPFTSTAVSYPKRPQRPVKSANLRSSSPPATVEEPVWITTTPLIGPWGEATQTTQDTGTTQLDAEWQAANLRDGSISKAEPTTELGCWNSCNPLSAPETTTEDAAENFPMHQSDPDPAVSDLEPTVSTPPDGAPTALIADWDERMATVNTFFSHWTPDRDSIEIAPAVLIADIPTFINCYLKTIASCPRIRTYEPYLNRMEQFMGLVRN